MSDYRYLSNAGLEGESNLVLSANSFTVNQAPITQDELINDSTQYSNLAAYVTSKIYDDGTYDLYQPGNFVLTFQLWGNNNSGTSAGHVVSLGPDPTVSKRWSVVSYVGAGADYKIALKINDVFRISGGTTWTNSSWRTIKLQRISGVMYLYVDAALQGSYADATVYGDNNEDMYISWNSPRTGPGMASQGDYVHVKNILFTRDTAPVYPFNTNNITYHYVAWGE